MKLVSFRVTNFRNVVDSGPVEVQPDITCLVGKNESGKTALLEALYRLNSAYPAKFVVEDQYPRWKYSKDRRSGDTEAAVPIWARFLLEDEDIAAISQFVGPHVLSDSHIELELTYANRRVMDIHPDERRVVVNLVERVNPDAISAFDSVNSFAQLQDICSSDLEEGTPLAEALTSEQFSDLKNRVNEIIGSHSTFRQALIAFAWQRCPEFFYFSEYSALPGHVNLAQLEAVDEDPSLQTARALISLAGTDVSSLREGDYNTRKAEMETVSNDLTDQVFEFWEQNRELKVVIDVDIEVGPGPNPNVQSVQRYLDLRVEDRRHGFTNNFGQRSSGFQWFFSFLAAFSAFEERPGRVVILLDEPGLTLHGKAQANFLRFIDERLAPKHQVLYTTHSPFMVEMGHLERVRIVEDKGSDEGSGVTDTALSRDPDTLFPLQAALGYDIAQSLFIGPSNLVIEGTSDFAYLQVMSDHLKAARREGLDSRWRLLPTGGASNIPAFVALMGPHLDVTVLVDAGTEGMQRLENMTARGLLKDQRLITVAEVLGTNQADIEDLFNLEDYISLFNKAFKKKVTSTKLPEGNRIVNRLAVVAGGKFDHGVPADYLLRHRVEILDTLSATTLDNFEKLFARVNETLSP